MKLELSDLALGTWRWRSEPAASAGELLELVRTALDCGIDTLDTAEIYGGYTVEDLLGDVLRLDPGVKAKVKIVTKAGIYIPLPTIPDRKIAHYNATAEQLIASAEASLKKLNVEKIDLFLVHRPDWLTPHSETADGLKRLLASGKVAEVGVSNYTPFQWDALSAHLGRAPMTNQVQFNPFHLDPIFDGSFDRCQQAGVRPMAWSPTAGGRLFKDTDEKAVRVRNCLETLGGKYGVPMDAICHAWVMGQASRPISVLGTNKPARVRSAAKAIGLKLEREDWYAVAEAARGVRIP